MKISPDILIFILLLEIVRLLFLRSHASTMHLLLLPTYQAQLIKRKNPSFIHFLILSKDMADDVHIILCQPLTTVTELKVLIYHRYQSTVTKSFFIFTNSIQAQWSSKQHNHPLQTFCKQTGLWLALICYMCQQN
ncbi:hypothetical protein PanWU01x14_188950 [Parasponia andersonii]|uniref:Uncharacterized protein n=1 Tax=Parasponia andersonii TaxID=3476 RepID=A0A2P5C317_PARAD|nr:hypothetical protein PanWU01x14_188950 [Parasponia andersonii]